MPSPFVGQLDQLFTGFLRRLLFRGFEELLIAHQVGEAIGAEEKEVVPLSRERAGEIELCIPVDSKSLINDISFRMPLGLLFA